MYGFVSLALKLLMEELLPASFRALLTHAMIKSSPATSPCPRSSSTFKVYLHHVGHYY